MKRGAYFLLLIIILISNGQSIGQQQTKKEMDREAIVSMAGCYEVEFRYTETFAPEVDYEKAYDYTSAAFEWAELAEVSDDKIVLQHLLIINDSTIIKHWRQDWTYESSTYLEYNGDFTWKRHNLTPREAQGAWLQSVYQVDDGPRYAGAATWVHVDGRSSWDMTANAPLPRREYSKRSDYNIMRRRNRVEITDNGWIHEQDNDKIIREQGTDKLLVQEKGYNIYNRRPDSDCLVAHEWWKKHHQEWALVQDKWDDILDKAEFIELNDKVDGKRLYEHLYYNSNPLDKAAIDGVIDQFVKNTIQP